MECLERIGTELSRLRDAVFADIDTRVGEHRREWRDAGDFDTKAAAAALYDLLVDIFDRMGDPLLGIYQKRPIPVMKRLFGHDGYDAAVRRAFEDWLDQLVDYGEQVLHDNEKLASNGQHYQSKGLEWRATRASAARDLVRMLE